MCLVLPEKRFIMSEIQNTSDVRERILRVSRELFIQNGYNGTSVRDIAAASSTNVAHIKYYFQSKYNLFEIIFEEAFAILIRRVFSVLHSDIPFFELLEQWIGAYYETLDEYPQIPIFILNEISQNPDRLVALIKRHNPEQIYAVIAARLDREMRKGTIRETPMIDFGLNVMSLCAFPFVFGKFAVKVTGIPMDEYRRILAQHRVYVTRFIMNALKP
jgi:AcrR family transcriptional regulator